MKQTKDPAGFLQPLLPLAHDRTAWLDDAGLLPGDRRQGVAEERLVVHRQGGDGAGRGCSQHVGGVEPAAEPDLDDREVGGRFGEQQEGAGGQHLEHGDGRTGVDRLDALQRRDQRRLLHQASGDAEPLGDGHEMRADGRMHLEPRRLGDRAQVGAGAALAVGAGDVDHRRQVLLGMAELAEQELQPMQAEVDQHRVGALQPLQHDAAAAAELGGQGRRHRRHQQGIRSIAGRAAGTSGSALKRRGRRRP